MLSEAYEGEAIKKSSAFEWHKWFKESLCTKITNETTLITFFDIKGTVHFEFIPQGLTVNKAY
jgi:hypothetical protein